MTTTGGNGTGNETTNVPLNAIDAVRRWESGAPIPDQVRRTLDDGVQALVASRTDSPSSDSDGYRAGLRTMMALMIARFGFTRREAELIVEWYALDAS